MYCSFLTYPVLLFSLEGITHYKFNNCDMLKTTFREENGSGGCDQMFLWCFTKMSLKCQQDFKRRCTPKISLAISLTPSLLLNLIRNPI